MREAAELREANAQYHAQPLEVRVLLRSCWIRNSLILNFSTQNYLLSTTVCKALPCPRIEEKVLFPPFFPQPRLEILVPSFGPGNFRTLFLRQILKFMVF